MTRSKKVFVVKKPSWFVSVIVPVLFRLWELIVDAVFWLKHLNAKKTILPAIDNPLLLQSATSLAHQIRTRKVIQFYFKIMIPFKQINETIAKVSSEQVVKAFIARIKVVNPIINCVVDNRFESAVEEAKKIDIFIASGQKDANTLEQETPFLGVPFTTKDCFAVKGSNAQNALSYASNFSFKFLDLFFKIRSSLHLRSSEA